jgi:HD-GYP domain-containing protein (c-di-GMP phosphodiesterase class II)
MSAEHAQLVAYATDLRRAVALERQRRRELEQAYLDAVWTLAAAVEARDPYTGGHGARVSEYAVALATTLGWERERVEEARLGGLLHDVGKLGIDDAVLRKPGKLDEIEWHQMRQHPDIGAGLLRRGPFLMRAAVYAQRHHERWDGRGYPAGLGGLDIPIGGRLLAVCDAFDAMTSSRSYRPAMDLESAIGELERGAASQFDPEMAAAFIEGLNAGHIEVQQTIPAAKAA